MAGWLELLRKLLLPPLLAVALAALLAPLLFLGATDLQSEPRYRLDGGDRPPAPLVNLAATALFRAGFIRISPPEVTGIDEKGTTGSADTQWDVVYLPHACTNDPVIKALVASEVYMRPAWRRQMEMALAEGWFALTGHVPDWSFGMAQVKLSTARKAITQAQRDYAAWLPEGSAPDISDRGLLALLADPCNAIRIATLVADGPRGPSDPTATVANRYRGAALDEALPGVVTYERLVGEMADRMLPGLISPSSLDEIYHDPYHGNLQTSLADLPRPLVLLACLQDEGGVMAGGWLYVPGSSDESDSQPVPRANFVRALASLDPQEARLVYFSAPQAAGSHPVPNGSLASLAALAEIDAFIYPGLLRQGWGGVDRRLSDETWPCTTGFGILSATSPEQFRDLLGLDRPPETAVSFQ